MYRLKKKIEEEMMMGDTEKGKTLLLIEDDPDVSDVIRFILEDEGYSVLSTGSGDETQKLLMSNPPLDAVLMDLTLPDMRAAQVVDIIRSMTRPDIPIIFLSGLRDIAEIAHELKATAHIEKPFETTELLNMLESVL